MNPTDETANIDEFFKLVKSSASMREDTIEGQSFLELFPKLPKHIQEKYIDKMFNLLRNWRYRDTSSYLEAIQNSLPNLKEIQVIFLWERALKDFSSQDDELMWFSHTTLEKIGWYLPKQKRSNLISQELILRMLSQSYPRRDKVASLLVAKAEALSQQERKSLQIKAFEQLFERSVDGKYPINRDLIKWIEKRGSLLEPQTIWHIWKDCCEKAKSGMSNYKAEFYALVTNLAAFMPLEKVSEACLDCYEFYKLLWYWVEPASVIGILISRLPTSQQMEQWRKIFIFLLSEPPANDTTHDPLRLAGAIIQKMPEPLRTGASDYFSSFVHGVNSHTDSKFEYLWRDVSL